MIDKNWHYVITRKTDGKKWELNSIEEMIQISTWHSVGKKDITFTIEWKSKYDSFDQWKFMKWHFQIGVNRTSESGKITGYSLDAIDQNGVWRQGNSVTVKLKSDLYDAIIKVIDHFYPNSWSKDDVVWNISSVISSQKEIWTSEKVDFDNMWSWKEKLRVLGVLKWWQKVDVKKKYWFFWKREFMWYILKNWETIEKTEYWYNVIDKDWDKYAYLKDMETILFYWSSFQNIEKTEYWYNIVRKDWDKFAFAEDMKTALFNWEIFKIKVKDWKEVFCTESWKIYDFQLRELI